MPPGGRQGRCWYHTPLVVVIVVRWDAYYVIQEDNGTSATKDLSGGSRNTAPPAPSQTVGQITCSTLIWLRTPGSPKPRSYHAFVYSLRLVNSKSRPYVNDRCRLESNLTTGSVIRQDDRMSEEREKAPVDDGLYNRSHDMLDSGRTKEHGERCSHRRGGVSAAMYYMDGMTEAKESRGHAFAHRRRREVPSNCSARVYEQERRIRGQQYEFGRICHRWRRAAWKEELPTPPKQTI
ncbi:hypothetical protein GY45DRAFT_1341433 [Cubamyces sp. BRFM 1775]|nr:hypothetical protein GY45DRAFT_1341433 [Cubamyces sp. BRFM 1775]